MRQDWLEDILAVLDAGSFVRAAERRNVTQSAFTRRIRTIEDTLGTPLFDRARKPVTLLPGLHRHEAEMRRLVSELRVFGDTLRDAALGAGNTVTLACQHAITATVSSGLVRRLSDHGCDSVRVRSANRDACLLLLLSGEADLVATYDVRGGDTALANPGFIATSLGAETLLAVCTPAVAAGLADGRMPVIAYPRDVFLGEVVAREIWSALPAGTTLQRRAETALTLAAYNYACDGIGVAWLPRSLVAADLDSGRLVSPEGAGPRLQLDIRLMRLAEPDRAIARSAWEVLTGPGPQEAGKTRHT